MRAKAFEPVTLVRSPMLTNSEPAPIATGSRPDSFIGGTGRGRSGQRHGQSWAAAPRRTRPPSSPRPGRSGERRCGGRQARPGPSLAGACAAQAAVATLLGQRRILRRRASAGSHRAEARLGGAAHRARRVPVTEVTACRDRATSLRGSAAAVESGAMQTLAVGARCDGRANDLRPAPVPGHGRRCGGAAAAPATAALLAACAAQARRRASARLGQPQAPHGAALARRPERLDLVAGTGVAAHRLEQALRPAPASTSCKTTGRPDQARQVARGSTASTPAAPSVKPAARRGARQDGRRAAGTQAATQIHVVGHTDSTGSDAINDALSVRARGQRTRDYLVGARRAVQPHRHRWSRREEPVAPSNTAAGRRTGAGDVRGGAGADGGEMNHPVRLRRTSGAGSAAPL